MNKLDVFAGETLLMELAHGGSLLTERTRHWVKHTTNLMVLGVFNEKDSRDDYIRRMHGALIETLLQEPWLRKMRPSQFVKVVNATMREILAWAYLSLEAENMSL